MTSIALNLQYGIKASRQNERNAFSRRYKTVTIHQTAVGLMVALNLCRNNNSENDCYMNANNTMASLY